MSPETVVQTSEPTPTFEVTVTYDFPRDWYWAQTEYAFTDYSGSGPTWADAYETLLGVLRRHWPGIRFRNLVQIKG